MGKNVQKFNPGLKTKIDALIIFNSAKKSLLKAIGATNKSMLKAFAEATSKDAKERVPVVSGRLRDSIKGNVRKKRSGKEGEFQASISTNTKGKARAYERFGKLSKKKLKERELKIQEYGYGLDVEVGRANSNYTNTPYLRPAFAAQAKRIPELMQRAAEIEALRQNPPQKRRRGRPKITP